MYPIDSTNHQWGIPIPSLNEVISSLVNLQSSCRFLTSVNENYHCHFLKGPKLLFLELNLSYINNFYVCLIFIFPRI
jgi:hypothetical protein